MSKLDEFIERPTPETYVSALDELQAGPDYAPYAGHCEEGAALFDRGKYQAVLDLVAAQSATLFLSPMAHQIAKMAAEKLGDAERAHEESRRVEICLSCVIESGDGSLDKPYLVSLVQDEYAVLSALGVEPGDQSLLRHGGRSLDLFKTSDGSEPAFDVTKMLARFKRR